ncbi:hypothetical protein D3C86_1882260 [compost metagenome]
MGVAGVDEVTVDVKVAQVEVDLGIFDKTRLGSKSRECGTGQGQGHEGAQGDLFHYCFNL